MEQKWAEIAKEYGAIIARNLAIPRRPVGSYMANLPTLAITLHMEISSPVERIWFSLRTRTTCLTRKISKN